MRLYLALAACFVLGLASNMQACFCGSTPPPKTAFENAHAVFSGRVAEIKVEGDSLIAEFVVSSVWKGVEGRTVSVSTDREGCGYGFKSGESYLVYCSEGKDHLWTGLCTRTKLLADAEEDLKEIGKGMPPEKNGK